ncbi:MAG: hypothetical protein IE916_00125 [Epsilonproteobacteria bacterium]|nr:hypothetical protein [Campylobacterota bacterium]
MRKCLLFAVMLSLLGADTCPSLTRLDFVDNASCHLSDMAKNYDKLKEKIDYRLKDVPIGQTAALIGTETKGQYHIDAVTTEVTALGMQSIISNISSVSSKIASAEMQYRYIMDLDLSIAEILIAQNLTLHNWVQKDELERFIPTSEEHSKNKK